MPLAWILDDLDFKTKLFEQTDSIKMHSTLSQLSLESVPGGVHGVELGPLVHAVHTVQVPWTACACGIPSWPWPGCPRPAGRHSACVSSPATGPRTTCDPSHTISYPTLEHTRL